jgi:hypothetical protein
MSKHMVSGTSIATAATANHCAAQIWNPSSTISIFVNALAWFHTVATADFAAVGVSTARGATPNNTATPDADNDFAQEGVPQTAWVLEMGTFGTQPTIATPRLSGFPQGAAIGAGLILPFGEQSNGFRIKPGNGMVIFTPVATILQPLYVTAWVTD